MEFTTKCNYFVLLGQHNCLGDPVMLLMGCNIISAHREITGEFDKVVLELPFEVISMFEINDVVLYACQKYKVMRMYKTNKEC